MTTFWKHIAQGFSLPLMAIILVILGHFFNQQIPSQLMATLAPVTILMATSLALQFKRSRLAFAGFILLILYFSNANWMPLSVRQLATWSSLSLALIISHRDRGVFTVHGLISALSILVIGALLWTLSPVIAQHLEPSLHLWLSLPAKTWIPAWQGALVLFAFMAALTRMLMQPSHCHGVICFLLLMLPWYLLVAHSELTNTVMTVLAMAIMAAVLLDSFQMAYRDELTGLPSRRALNQYALTLSNQYTVVMLDVDHFKKFNDKYGHDVGDQVLKLVAAKMQQLTGGGKTYRYGGEEFTAVFPRKSVEEVMPHIEALRESIANYKMKLRGDSRDKSNKKARDKNSPSKQPTVSVTISLGVAERQKGYSFDEVVKSADEALYRAKKNGRNCSAT